VYVCIIVVNCTYVVFVDGCTLLDAASVVLILIVCSVDPGVGGVFVDRLVSDCLADGLLNCGWGRGCVWREGNGFLVMVIFCLV
jgi:hypothetical protein